jgi:hypothetical protein
MNHAQLSSWSTVLTYATIVVGLIFALLAYRLLAREQRLPRPRLVTIQAVYGLMALASVMILAGFASEYVKLDFESLQTEVTAASTALDEQRAANETLRVKLQLVREVAHTLDAQTRKPAPTATQDCVESAQPEHEQLLALGQRLDAVVNR